MGASCCGSVEDPAGAPVLCTPRAAPAAAVPAAGLPDGLDPWAAYHLAGGEHSARAEISEEEALVRGELTPTALLEANGRAEIAREEDRIRERMARYRDWDKERRRRIEEDVPGPHAVHLNVYRICPLGYHSGVEVGGSEVFYGGTGGAQYDFSVPGLEMCVPGRGPVGQFLERIYMGESQLSSQQIVRVVAGLRPSYSAGAYHLFYNNCNHFSDALITALGCPGRTPWWLNCAASCAARVVPDSLFNTIARANGSQRQRPPDCEREACSCGERFGWCTHRHHCNKCGYAFCANCTRQLRLVPMLGPRPVAVCASCATMLPAAAPAPPAGPAPGAPPPAQPDAARPPAPESVPLSVGSRRAHLDVPGGRCSPAGSG